MAITLVNFTAFSGLYNNPGPQNSVIGNTTGNLLVAFGAWDTTASQSAPRLPPASSVADSAGNWWRLAGDSGNQNPAARCAIWVCANAMAIPSTGWWSFTPQGYTGGLTFAVAEFSGLPAGYMPAIDFSVPASGSGTTISMSATTSQADYTFAIGCAGSTAPTLTAPSSPWTTLGSGTCGGTNPDGIIASCSYATYAANASVTASYGISLSSEFAGVIVGISQAGIVPLSGNPSYPYVKTEMAFGASAGDFSAAIPDTAWTDISSRTLAGGEVASITVTRGRQYELAQPESGTLSIALNNLDGAFDPLNVSSPYYTNALNTNPTFQSGISPWTGADGATVAQSSTYTYSTVPGGNAVYSLQVTPDGVTAIPYAINSGYVSISPNNVYTGSAQYLCPSGWSTGGQTFIYWYDSTHTFISGSTATQALPASTAVWTQISVTASPPSNAVYARLAVRLLGTPASSVVLYVTEAIFAAGSAAQAGLVRLNTPVRVSAFWHSRQYPVGYGFVERFPQVWPDLPQWGFSTMEAIDTVGIASSVNLPSAVQGEILVDEPYACFPFSESYSTSVNSINGTTLSSTECNGLIAINTSRLNQATATYRDGNQPVATGQSLPFYGDSGTGFGCTTYASIDTSGNRGPGVIYGPDPNLPLVTTTNGGYSAEMWFSVPQPTLTSATVYVPLMRVMAQPNSSSPHVLDYSAPGFMLAILWSGNNTGVSVGILNAATNAFIAAGLSFTFGALYHMIVTVNSGILTIWLDGVSAASGLTWTASSQITALGFGSFFWAYDYAVSFTPNWNYTIAYGTIYNYTLSSTRIGMHYIAGSQGFANDPVSWRFGRYLAWGNLGLNPAGVNTAASDYFQLAAAYSTKGNSLAAALNADLQGSGGTWYGNANGNLVILPRTAMYNQPVITTFGDNTGRQVNVNANFNNASTAGWAALNGTFTVTGSPPAGAMYPYAGVYVNNGVSAGAAQEINAAFSATAGSSYHASAWVYTTGTVVTIGFTWLNASGGTISSSLATITVQANGWVYTDTTQVAPANTASAYIRVGTSTASSATVYMQAVTARLVGEIPYTPALGFDYDNTYLQNVTQATLSQGPNSSIAPVNTDETSVTEYFTRGPQQLTVSGNSYEDAYDAASWTLQSYSQPHLRVQAVTIDAAKYPTAFAAVFQTDISSIAVVNRRPVGAPAYSLTVSAQRVSHSIGPGVWTTTYQMSPYSLQQNVLTPGVSGHDTLGTTTLGW